jgi:hypothetical protein
MQIFLGPEGLCHGKWSQASRPLKGAAWQTQVMWLVRSFTTKNKHNTVRTQGEGGSPQKPLQTGKCTKDQTDL